MQKNESHHLKNFSYIIIIILGLLFIFTSVSIYLNRYQRDIEQRNLKTFEQMVELFKDRLESYVYGLQGMGGVYRVKNFNPSVEDISTYAVSRGNFKNFEGSLGFGFIRVVKKENLKKYTKEMQKIDQRFNYKELGAISDEDSFIIEKIEPYSSNQSALGLNVSSEINRKMAALEAIKSARATITNELALVQSNLKTPGYLIYLPLYKNLEIPKTDQERPRNIVGFSYTPIVSSFIVRYLRSKMFIDFNFSVKMEGDKNYFFNDIKNNHPTLYEKEVTVLGKNWKWRGDFPIDKTFMVIKEISLVVSFLISFLYVYFVLYIRRLLAEKKGFEERFSKVEIWLNTVLNNISLSVIATDKYGVIQTINSSGLSMLGYEAEELLNKQTPAIIHDPAEVAERAKTLSEELGIEITPGFEVFVVKSRNGKPDINEWTYVRKNGEHFLVRLIVTTLFNREGEIVGYLGIAEDISERKKLEQLIEEQRLHMIESAKLSTLGEMAGGIAHEINNPLAIISSKVSQIVRKIDRGSIDLKILKEDLEKVDQTVFRISKIVTGLRSLSRESTNDQFEVVNLGGIIDEVIGLCFERFKNHGVKLDFDITQNLKVRARGAQIGQVLLNLLNNSFDALENEDEKWVKIQTYTDTDFVFIIIIDSGKGIPGDVLAKIFDPFFTTKPVGKGTGLGLSISKRIIKDHNGEFFYNKRALNTTFVIILPRVKDE